MGGCGSEGRADLPIVRLVVQFPALPIVLGQDTQPPVAIGCIAALPSVSVCVCD